MANAELPYTVYPKKRKYKSGKETIVWYYSLNPACGLSEDVCASEQRKSTGQRTKGKAVSWVLQERIPQLMELEEKNALPPTLKEFLMPYYVVGICPHIERVENDRRRPVSLEWITDSRSRLDRLVCGDPIAEKLITEITPGDLEDWKKRKKVEGHGPRVINMTLGALKSCFREGIHRRDISYDPTQVVKKIREDDSSHGIYSLDEMRLMFVDLPQVWYYPPEYHGTQNGKVDNLMVFTYAFLFASTGERPRALLKLKWSDYSGSTITLRPEIIKTGVGRTIPLIPRMIGLLDDLRSDSLRVSDDDWIFGYDSGKPLLYNWFRDAWERMMRNTGFPENDTEGLKRVPYSLKHSLITHLVDEGVDPIFAREYVGHSHGSGGGDRQLTRVQARYKRSQTEKLRTEVLPVVEKIFA